MRSMSYKKLDELRKSLDILLDQVKTFKEKTPKELWLIDLKKLWESLP